jgi:hypothetical protein
LIQSPANLLLIVILINKAVGDSPKGPLNNQEETRLKPEKTQNANQLAHLKHIHSTTATLVAPAARQCNAADAPRVSIASLEG